MPPARPAALRAQPAAQQAGAQITLPQFDVTAVPMPSRPVTPTPPPPPKLRRNIPLGAKVKIISGPFSGLAGIYQGMSTRQRELVLLNVLGATRPVKIASASISLQ